MKAISLISTMIFHMNMNINIKKLQNFQGVHGELLEHCVKQNLEQ
jgi:hypothetical protein